MLAVIATAYVSARRRRPCLVYHRGRWIHRYRGVTLVDVHPMSVPPEAWEAEVRSISLRAYEPSAGDVVIDVGAGVGHETRVLSRLVGARGHVYAIEANPRVFACLVDMVRRNHLDNVTPLNVAAADFRGSVTLTDSEDHLENTIVGATDGVEVRADTLDSLAAEFAIEEAAFLKMNIEGAEIAALDGATSLLNRVANVCISCHDFVADRGGDPRTRTLAGVRNRLDAAGFTVRTWDDHRPWARDTLYGSRTIS
jgi:FkbM family methyltransferase